MHIFARAEVRMNSPLLKNDGRRSIPKATAVFPITFPSDPFPAL
jgi:hypothetical protein